MLSETYLFCFDSLVQVWHLECQASLLFENIFKTAIVCVFLGYCLKFISCSSIKHLIIQLLISVLINYLAEKKANYPARLQQNNEVQSSQLLLQSFTEGYREPCTS